LPGGGIEDGEKPEEALFREVLEETGWRIRPGNEIGRAEEYVNVPERNLYLIKQGHFYRAEVVGMSSQKLKTDHEVTWVTTAEFAEKAAHESHVWAIKLIETARDG